MFWVKMAFKFLFKKKKGKDGEKDGEEGKGVEREGGDTYTHTEGRRGTWERKKIHRVEGEELYVCSNLILLVII